VGVGVGGFGEGVPSGGCWWVGSGKVGVFVHWHVEVWGSSWALVGSGRYLGMGMYAIHIQVGRGVAGGLCSWEGGRVMQGKAHYRGACVS